MFLYVNNTATKCTIKTTQIWYYSTIQNRLGFSWKKKLRIIFYFIGTINLHLFAVIYNKRLIFKQRDIIHSLYNRVKFENKPLLRGSLMLFVSISKSLQFFFFFSVGKSPRPIYKYIHTQMNTFLVNMKITLFAQLVYINFMWFYSGLPVIIYFCILLLQMFHNKADYSFSPVIQNTYSQLTSW